MYNLLNMFKTDKNVCDLFGHKMATTKANYLQVPIEQICTRRGCGCVAEVQIDIVAKGEKVIATYSWLYTYSNRVERSEVIELN